MSGVSTGASGTSKRRVMRRRDKVRIRKVRVKGLETSCHICSIDI